VLELDPDLVWESERSMVVEAFAILGGDALVPEQARLQSRIERNLRDPGAQAFYRALRSRPLEVWSIDRRPTGRGFAAKLLLGPSMGPGQHFDLLLGRRGSLPKGAGAVAGWSLDYQGCRLFLELGPLEPEGVKELQESCAEVPRGPSDRGALAASDAFFRSYVKEILRVTVDPHGELAGPQGAEEYPFLPFQAVQTKRQRQEVLAGVPLDLAFALEGPPLKPVRRKGAEAPDPGFLREDIARVRDEADLSVLRERLAKARDAHVALLASRWGERPHQDRVHYEAVAPVAKILQVFGAHPDGTLTQLSDEEILGRPARLLLLGEAHQLFEGLSADAPLRAALARAQRLAGAPWAAEVVAAYERYRAESRWVVTFAAPTPQEQRLAIIPMYDVILHGLKHLFDPAILETPIASLELCSGGGGRLRRVLRAISKKARDPDGGWLVRHLPDDGDELVRQIGFGIATRDSLLGALLELAGSWRQGQSGARPKPVARGPQVNEARERLKTGLADLAALFEEG
jgi:hypothetical protein